MPPPLGPRVRLGGDKADEHPAGDSQIVGSRPAPETDPQAALHRVVADSVEMTGCDRLQFHPGDGPSRTTGRNHGCRSGECGARQSPRTVKPMSDQPLSTSEETRAALADWTARSLLPRLLRHLRQPDAAAALEALPAAAGTDDIAGYWTAAAEIDSALPKAALDGSDLPLFDMNTAAAHTALLFACDALSALRDSRPADRSLPALCAVAERSGIYDDVLLAVIRSGADPLEAHQISQLLTGRG